MKNYFAIAHAKLKEAVPWGPDLANWKSFFTKGPKGEHQIDKAGLKQAQDTHHKQLSEYLVKTNADVDALLPKVSPQVLAIIGPKPEQKETMGDSMFSNLLTIYHEKLKDAVAAGPVSSAPAPSVAVAPKVAPAATTSTATPTPKVTAETLGKTVAALATSPNPAIRTPIVEGLQKSIEAATKPRPDFSFLGRMERAQISMEFDSLGGLSEQKHALYMLRRRQYCEAHHLTPEQVSGASQVVIPDKITAAELKQREAKQQAEKHLPSQLSALHDVNLKLLALHKEGKMVPANANAQAIVARRADILGRVNKLEATLGKPLTP